MTRIQKNLNINSPAFIPSTGGSSTCSSSPPSPSSSPAPPPYLAHLYPPLPSNSAALKPSPSPSPPSILHLKDFRVTVLAHPSGSLDDAHVDLHLASMTLASLREALLASSIAAPARDVFFPSWTTSVRVSYASQDDEDLHLIETDDALAALAAEHVLHPGDVSLRLEQCHQPKYSRFAAASPKPAPAKMKIKRRGPQHCIDGPTTVSPSLEVAPTRARYYDAPYQMIPTNVYYVPVQYAQQPWHHPMYPPFPPVAYFGGMPALAWDDRSAQIPYAGPWGLGLKSVNMDNF